MVNLFTNYIHNALHQIEWTNQMLLDKVSAIEVEIKGLKEEIRRVKKDRTTFQNVVFGLLCDKLNDDAPCNSCARVVVA